MGLKIRRVTQTKYKLLFASLAIMALAVQPLYGFVASRVANAASSSNVVTEVDKTNNSIKLNFKVNEDDVNGTACFNVEADSNTTVDSNKKSLCLPVGTDIDVPFDNVSEWIRVNETLLDGSFTDWQRFDVLVPDILPPTFAINSPSDKSYVRGVQTISAQITDPSDITKVLMNVAGKSLSWTNGKSSTITRDGDIFSTTVDTNDIADGPVQVSLRGTDGEGNTRYWNNNATLPQHVFYVDNTDPTITLRENQTAKPSGSYFKTSETIRIQPQDANLGKLFINGNELTQYYGSKSFGINWYVAQHPTVEKFVIVAEDKAGNTSNESIVMIDRTVPTINIKSGTGKDDGSIGADPNYSQVSFKLYDKNKNLKEVELNGHIYNRGGEWSDLNWVNINKSHLIQGENTVIVRDIEGNSSELKFNFDSIAPSITGHTYSNNGKVTPDDVKVTITTSEPVEEPAGWTREDDTHFTKVFDRNGAFSVDLIDLAGNRATIGDKANGYEVKGIDKDAPTFNISDGAVFNSSSKLVSVNEENIKTVTVNGVAVTDFSRNKPYEFTVTGEGRYTVVAKDKAGHESTITFVIDTTPPSIPKIIPTDSSAIKGEQKFTITSDGNLKVSANVDGLENNHDGTWSLDTTKMNRNTKVVITAVATDKAGNESTATASFFVKNDAPTLTVNRDVTTSKQTTLSGTVTPATDKTTVTVSFRGENHPVSVDTTSGRWKITIPVSQLSAGEYSYAVSVNDGYNNTVAYSSILTVARVTSGEPVGTFSDRGGVNLVADPTSSNNGLDANRVTDRSVALNTDDEETDTLGDSTANAASGEDVKGAADEKVQPGLAWYWWALIVAAIAAIWWWIAAARKRNQDA